MCARRCVSLLARAICWSRRARPGQDTAVKTLPSALGVYFPRILFKPDPGSRRHHRYEDLPPETRPGRRLPRPDLRQLSWPTNHRHRRKVKVHAWSHAGAQSPSALRPHALPEFLPRPAIPNPIESDVPIRSRKASRPVHAKVLVDYPTAPEVCPRGALIRSLNRGCRRWTPKRYGVPKAVAWGVRRLRAHRTRPGGHGHHRIRVVCCTVVRCVPTGSARGRRSTW